MDVSVPQILHSCGLLYTYAIGFVYVYSKVRLAYSSAILR